MLRPRLGTRQENNCGSKPNSNNTSGVKGVHRHKTTGKWVARMTVAGKYRHIGYFDNIEDAAAAYQAAAAFAQTPAVFDMAATLPSPPSRRARLVRLATARADPVSPLNWNNLRYIWMKNLDENTVGTLMYSFDFKIEGIFEKATMRRRQCSCSIYVWQDF